MISYSWYLNSFLLNSFDGSSFHFLFIVEPAPGVDLEGLEVAKECLAEVFKLDSPSVHDDTRPDSLIDIFHSLDSSNHLEKKSDHGHRATAVDVSSSSFAPRATQEKLSEASKTLVLIFS